MRNFGDRDNRGGNDRWDQDIECMPLDKKPRRWRLVGPVQDIGRHWCILDAGKHADSLGKLRKQAIRRGIEFKPPRDPRAVPFLCPRFDLYREKFVDYRDEDSGKGYYAKEVLSLADLERHNIKVPPRTKKIKDVRFSPDSLEAKKAIVVKKLYCPMHDDFGKRAEKRTWWHGYERKMRKNRRTKKDEVAGNSGFGIVGKSGMPNTPMMGIEKIAKARQMDPSDPAQGFDLIISLDTSQKAADMYSVSEIRDEGSHPLTKDEKREAFGRYKLADGTKCTFLDLIRLRGENPAALKGVKEIEAAAIMPLEEMAAGAVDADDMKEFMVSNGYYDDSGKPRVELMDIKDDDDNSWSDRGGDDDDEDDDEDDAPKRRRTRSKPEGDKPKRRRTRSRDSEDEKPKRRKKRPSEDEKPKRRKKPPSSDEPKRKKKRPSKDSPKKRRRSSMIDDD